MDSSESSAGMESEIFTVEEDEGLSDVNDEMMIAQEESRAVKKSKILVYVVVLACALTTSIVTWFLVRKDETNTFETEFRQFADALVVGANANALTIFGQMETLATSLTSHTLHHTNFTTDDNNKHADPRNRFSLYNFDVRTRQLQVLAGAAELILWAPFIRDVGAWEDYTQARWEEIQEDTFSNTPLHPAESQQEAPEQLPSPRIFPVPSQDQALAYNVEDEPLVVPILQYGPLRYRSPALVNLDLNSHVVVRQAIQAVADTQHSVLIELTDVSFLVPPGVTNQVLEDEYFASNRTKLQSLILEPIFDRFRKPRQVSGILMVMEPWSAYFEKELPDGLDGFLVNLRSTCLDTKDRTFRVNGRTVQFEGVGDLHDPQYDHLGREAAFAAFARSDSELVGSGTEENDDFGAEALTSDASICDYSIVVYPSHAFEDSHRTSKPFWYAILVLAIFLLAMITFAIYDIMVQRRQAKVLRKAQDTTNLVQSLFPKEVGRRLMADAERKREALEQEQREINRASRPGSFRPKGFLKRDNKSSSFVATGEGEQPHRGGADISDAMYSSSSYVDMSKRYPIAEYYTESTIMFADLVGFTSWSSSREPKTVFMLLETLYGDFDIRAQQQRVFKIETVGDCYVAAAGVPEPHPHHFLAMAKFAKDCLKSFSVLTKQLEAELGPETRNLGLRVGLHSGPVTGGVLRNDRARFQLFGDTMNTASRLETTGLPNRIHISQETADLLMSVGKAHWLKPREELVVAKGKGELQTYWIVGSNDASASSGSCRDPTEEQSLVENSAVSALKEQAPPLPTRTLVPQPSFSRLLRSKGRDKELASWIVDILGSLLQHVNVGRGRANIVADSKERLLEIENELQNQKSKPFKELDEMIAFLPNYTSTFDVAEKSRGELDPTVAKQLKEYVNEILSTYHNHEFHNFEHASQVLLSLKKLFRHIIPPRGAMFVPDHTLGLGNNAYVQFCMTMAALIHHADHSGFSNQQLAQVMVKKSIFYEHQSVGEQNAIDVAWGILMRSDFQELRHAIYTNEAEFTFVRKMIVHSVLATDILDSVLESERLSRWIEAFEGFEPGKMQQTPPSMAVRNRQRTVVVESLMQAASILHTMQPWQIYTKWNRCQLRECEVAFQKVDNALEEDSPSVLWYDREVCLFESFVTPLASRLEESGVFGPGTRSEFLPHASMNLKEWVKVGRNLVVDWKQDLRAQQDLLLSSDEEDNNE